MLSQGLEALGINSRCRSTRARALGWKPVHGKAEFLASIKTELEDGRWKGNAKKFVGIISEMFKGNGLLA
jgi:hypothetical protein